MKRRDKIGILVIDTETGGFTAATDALLEIGVGHFYLHASRPADTVPGKFQGYKPAWAEMVGMYNAKIAPAENMRISGAALTIQGIRWSDLHDQKRISEETVYTELSDWLSAPLHALTLQTRATLPIWAHNASFDRDFYTAFLDRVRPTWKKDAGLSESYQWRDKAACFLGGRNARWNCSRYAAEKLIGLGELLDEDGKPPFDAKTLSTSASLDALLPFIGEPERFGHTAMQDLMITAKLVAFLLEKEGWL